MKGDGIRIVGDFGGTSLRLAVLDEAGRPAPSRSYPSAVFAGPAEVLARFLADDELEPRAVEGLALAVAGPVSGDEVSITNLHWRFSLGELSRRFGVARCIALNDFEALALAIPELESGDVVPVKSGDPVAGGAIAVVGPGTGLGVAGLVPSPSGWSVVAGEGGHRDLAASTALEWRIVELLGERFGGHVSAERVLSGPGLELIHSLFAELEGRTAEARTAADISELARQGDSQAIRTVSQFSAWLGAFAGDLALTLGARRGVFLAGGVLAGLGSAFDAPAFTARFVAKGRFESYLARIPVRRIIRADAALLGCASALAQTTSRRS